MTHTYNVTGMTCEGCSAKVSHLLKNIPEVTNVTINLEKAEAIVTMEKHIFTGILQDSLKDYPKYQLSEKKEDHHISEKTTFDNFSEDTRNWFETYKPIVLIFVYISIISSIIALYKNSFDIMLFMRAFMAGFFLIFSFFKMLDLKGFANSYSMYDIIAKKFSGWGYIYAFLELLLGIAFVINFNPFVTNTFTAALMTVSLLGVLQSVVNKNKIQCACLGAVFNLPMSTVTIIEDGLMIAMSIAMLFIYL